MRDWLEEYFPHVFVSICIVLAVASIVWIVVADSHHTKFLREHGCQVYYRDYTGRTRMIGKTHTREIITVYECADGKRFELN